MNIFRAYHRIMTNHPIKTQCLTTTILITTGDIIAQKVIEKQPELIVRRTIKFATFGLFFVGPSMSIWYRILDRRFGSAKQILLKPYQKVMIDQATFNPWIHMMAIIVLGLLGQESIESIKTNINDNFIDIMKNSYKVWPAVQLINFYLIPLNYRAVFTSGFSLAWNSYLAWKLGEKEL